MRYENIASIERNTAESLRHSGATDELRIAVLSVALHDPDPLWAERYCVSLSQHKDPIVRGNAILGFGHLARIHGHLDLSAIEPIIRAGLADQNAYVRGQADSAAGDIETFLGVSVRREH